MISLRKCIRVLKLLVIWKYPKYVLISWEFTAIAGVKNNVLRFCHDIFAVAVSGYAGWCKGILLGLWLY